MKRKGERGSPCLRPLLCWASSDNWPGMPLSLITLRKVDLYPLMDKFGNKMAAWKGGLMAKSGRLVLLTSLLSSLAIYMMTVHRLPAWVIRRIVQQCRAWPWSGENSCSSGKCRVSWVALCRPKHLGGLGVFDFDKFSRALLIRWLWLAWQDQPRPWVGCNCLVTILIVLSSQWPRKSRSATGYGKFLA